MDRLFRWRERKSDQLLEQRGSAGSVRTERCGERVELWRGAERWPWSTDAHLAVQRRPYGSRAPSALPATSTFARKSGISMDPTPGSCRPVANTRPASTTTVVVAAAVVRMRFPNRRAWSCLAQGSRSSRVARDASRTAKQNRSTSTTVSRIETADPSGSAVSI